MPRPRLAMRKVRDILRLAVGQGLSRRQVGAALGIPFTTVADHLRRAEGAGLGWPLPEGLDDTALEALLFRKEPAPPTEARPVPDWHYVHKELRRPGVTLMLLWLEYKECHPDGGYSYSQFCHHYRAFQGHLDLVMRQEHRAGEKLFVDFPGQRLPIYDRRTGEVAIYAELFVGVLGASNYLYAEAVASQELAHWVGAHVRAFEFFGSVPRIVVCDNLRAGVKQAHRYEPEINATYSEMAAHYGVVIIPTRRRKPRDKAKVEAGVLLAERWILARLRNRRFYSLADANAVISELVVAINDRPFRKMAGSRRSLFEELERPVMRPLPPTRYEFATWRLGLKVNIDYHVDPGAGHYYSVPYQLVGQRVDVRSTSGVVEVFHSARRVASHLRSYGRGRHTTDSAHMPDSHRRHAEWTPSRIIAWARRTGPATAGLAEAILASRPHPEQGYRSCLGIIRLGDRYGVERVEAACARALAARALSYRSVESILRHGLDAPCPSNDRLGPIRPTPTCAAPPTTDERNPMLTNATLDGLHTLRLPGMARGLVEQREHPDYDALGFEDRLGMLVDRELTERQNRRLDRMLRAARLRVAATIEGIDFGRPRGVERTQVLSLAESHWVGSHHSIVIVGATGLGKTYLGCALANAAIRRGHSALYLRGPRLHDEITLARAEGRLARLMISWARTDVLLIDDFLLRPLSPDQAADVLEVIEDRVGLRSTIVTSQLPVAMWHEALGEPTVADGILDRLLENVHRIELRGESMRRRDRSSAPPGETVNENPPTPRTRQRTRSRP